MKATTIFVGFATFPIAFLLILLAGCSSASFSAIPADLDLSQVIHQTVEMKAARYEFSPASIRVKAGTLLMLKIQSTEGTHGFRLGDFGVDERLEENEEKTIEVYFPRAGEFSFRCSHFCGWGHLGMTGKIIVE